MRLLDEATTSAVAGEIAVVRMVEVICCHLIDACQRVRDLDRAAEWCLRVEEISDRYADADMFATCRTHYADLLVWRGQWSEAERTLTAACRDLGGVPRKVADGLVRLAELRRPPWPPPTGAHCDRPANTGGDGRDRRRCRARAGVAGASSAGSDSDDR